jgi:hypothetical protein
MSRAHDGDEAARTSAHERVLELEASIATRLTAAEQAGDELARAKRQADQLLAEAEAQVGEEAQRRRSATISAAHAEADRLIAAGIRRATDLSAMAARRRDADVAAVVSAVLPVLIRSSQGVVGPR